MTHPMSDQTLARYADLLLAGGVNLQPGQSLIISAELGHAPLVRAAVAVPIIASGGAGAVEHFAPAVDAGADAVLAASVFHFGELTIPQVKAAMSSAGITVR